MSVTTLTNSIAFSGPKTFTLDKLINTRYIYTSLVDCALFELKGVKDKFHLEAVYIYMCIYMCVYIYVCAYIYIYIYMYIYI